jgi:hypothetical protein
MFYTLLRRKLSFFTVIASIVFGLVSCSSAPTPSTFTHNFLGNAGVEKTANISFNVTDQQAYGLAKAWLMTKRNAKLLSDDSAGGVLSGTGDVEKYTYTGTYRIFISNGIARITVSFHVINDYDITMPYNFTDSNIKSAYNEADKRAERLANELAENEINSFRKSLN